MSRFSGMSSRSSGVERVVVSAVEVAICAVDLSGKARVPRLLNC
jgi:hypothetical protein